MGFWGTLQAKPLARARCLEHRLCSWPEPGMDQRRRPPGTIAKTLWLQGARTWATAQQETESHSESIWKPSILLGEFRYRFRSWSNNWPLYWNLEWILYRILAPICQQPCLFWTVQVSITDFASLAAVAEGKVWLAGPSAMGVTVAQRIIEYSNPFKSRKGKRERERVRFADFGR